MVTLFSHEDLSRLFGTETLERAREYQRGGRVRQLSVSKDGNTISGSVAGGRPRPYSQIISVARDHGGVRISGYCSCPMGQNCKHVAAALLQQLEEAACGAPGPLPAIGQRRDLEGFGSPPDASPGSPGMEVSQGVQVWLDRLALAGKAAAGASPKQEKNRTSLLYILNHHGARDGQAKARVRLRPVSIRLLKDGRIAEEKPYDPENVARTNIPARYVTEADVDVLRSLVWPRRADMRSLPDIVLSTDRSGPRVLMEALATGRVRYGAADGRVLAAGPRVAAEPRWLRSDDGRQKLAFVPTAAESGLPRLDLVLAMSTPHYVDLQQGLVGPIETGLPAQLAAELAAAPEVAWSEAAVVREIMARKPARRAVNAGASALEPSGPHDHPDLPLPEAPENVETRRVQPVPRLELFIAEARLKHSLAWYARDAGMMGTFKVPLVRLVFDYDGRVAAHGSPGSCLQYMDGEQLIVVPRDIGAEQAARARLRRLELDGLEHAPFDAGPGRQDWLFLFPNSNRNGYELISTFNDPDRFLNFSTTTVRELQAEGWQVAFSDDYPYRIADGEASWWAGLEQGSGIDWFSFALGVDFEGTRINLVPTLARLIGELPPELVAAAMRGTGEADWLVLCSKLKLYHTLEDGRLLPLPGERVAPILKSLIELVGPRGDRVKEGRVRIHRAEAGALADFAKEAGDGIAWAAGAERLLELGARLRSRKGLARLKPPAKFKAKLRPYQAEGFAWLDFLRDAGFGGVLADDMGLGKTVQALAFLCREKASGRLDRPALILAPTSVLPNWKAEVARFAPGLTVLALHGPARAQHFDQIGSHDVVLTTYPLLARDADVLLDQEFHVAILDEAQAIKNPKAAITGFAHRIKARHRLALTGTPLENNLGEVWSLFQFLAPGLLGDESTFRRTFRTPIEKHGSREAQTFLTRRLKPFMLRRTKEQVATELPKKTEIIEHVVLEGAQRDLYETVRALMHRKVREAIDSKGLAKSHIVFLDALLKLRQVCCDPRLLSLPAARRVSSSAKLERLMEMLPELIGEGRRVLLFSQFTSMLELIEAELRKTSISWVKLTGQTTDREAPVKAFQAGEVPLFLLSLKAGGTGLNLTAADTVIHYDPWWNPAVEHQATDRAHRIGQNKPVFVYKLITEEGIEQAIEQMKARKAALADALFSGGTGKALDLTEADISALFAPLSPSRQKLAA